MQAVLDAANSGDTEAFLACFSADGAVDDWGREFRGPDRIRAWSEAEFIGRQVSLAVQHVEQRADETVVTARVGGNGFNGPSHFGFRLDGAGRLVAMMRIRA